MLRAGLKGLFDDPAATLEAVGVAPTARAETVDIAGFAHLPVPMPGKWPDGYCHSRRRFTKSVSPTWRSRFSRSAARMAWT